MSEHSIGKTIAALRKSKGWTQVELAEKLNVSDKAVSKWESEAGLPEIFQLPVMANLFDVSIDYLMTGKTEEKLLLDDMDSAKRKFYLIKKDDVDNYVKYNYPARTYFDDFKGNDSAINAILANKSVKIFNACVEKGIALNPSLHKSYTLVGAMYERIDDLIKMACESDSLAFFKAIDFLSFAVGDKARQLNSNDSVRIVNRNFKHTYNSETAYLVSPETFEFIFANPTTSKRIIEYIASYRPFNEKTVRYGSSVCDWGDINGTFYFLEQNIIEQLYKTKRFDLLTYYMQQIAKAADETIERFNLSERDWQISYFLKNGYLLRHDSGSYGMTKVVGKLISIGKSVIDLAIENLDKHWVKTFIEYNKNIALRYSDIKVYAPNDKELATLFEDERRQRRIKKIKAATTLTDKERREQLFEENALPIYDAISADDYDLFVRYPVEEIRQVSLWDVTRFDCKDIKFYIYVVNTDDDVNRLNAALKFVLEKHPDRYDILDVLLSAGAVLDDNLAFTNILKQNVVMCLGNKESGAKTVDINSNVTKNDLLRSVEEGKSEFVIVNLTMVLERKLKNKLLKQDMDLIDMIDEAHNLNIISDLDCKMLHNLRKARNGIMHQSGKFYYTDEIVKSWINIVYSI